MSLIQQFKIFINSIYLLLRNSYVSNEIKRVLVQDFIRYSYKTFLLRKFGKKYRSEVLLGKHIEVDYYPDFVSQFVEIFVHFIYYFPIHKKMISIIDCGSNIGVSVLFFKIFYPNSKIIAFEPDPHAYSLLVNNVKKNNLKGVTCINAAIGSKKGKISFYTQHEDAQTRSVANSAINFSSSNEKITVDSLVLDKYIDNPVEILKMDIEGVEAEVLAGLKNINKIAHIALEFHNYEHLQGKNSLSTILKVFETNKFFYNVTTAEGQLDFVIENHLLIVRAKRANN